MPENNQYSEEVQQLMGKMPGWIIRWGVAMIFILFLIILAISYYIKYPQIVSAPVVLTTLNPPVDLLARSSGKIERIFVENNTAVDQGTPVALLTNTARYDKIAQLETQLHQYAEKWEKYLADTLHIEPSALGDLQSPYSQFIRQLKLYANYRKTDRYASQLDLLEKQIRQQQEGVTCQEKQYEYQIKDMQYETNRLSRDSIMYAKQAKSLTDYETARRNHLQKQTALLGAKLTLSNAEIALYNLYDQRIALTIQNEDQQIQYELQLADYRQQLIVQIELWQKQYLLTSPINGKINFSKYWSPNQNIAAGDRLATVVPAEARQIIGKLAVPSTGFAKVKTGDAVNVKLSSYPYMEYGLLKGKITSLSAIPEPSEKEISYLAEIEFPDGFTSSYNIRLNFIQQMDGTGEIITKDMRLIDKFLMPFKSILNNNIK